MILQITIIFIFVFIGYIIGRWGDNYLNFWIKDPSWTPHHWIYGIFLMLVAIFFTGNTKLEVFYFGLGLFISDLKDFLNLRFFGSDNKEKKEIKFWHID
jgi:hypothetical protein